MKLLKAVPRLNVDSITSLRTGQSDSGFQFDRVAVGLCDVTIVV